MDAAQTNIKKIAFFLATALLLTAPFHASASTLNVSTTSVTIGSASCNDFQTVQVTSSDGAAIPFTVAVTYDVDGGVNGQWVYARITNGPTSTGAAVTGSTGTTGIALTIGRNISISPLNDTAHVVITDTNNSADSVTIQVNYSQNNSCAGNGGSVGNSYIQVTPATISLTAGTDGTASQSVIVQNLSGAATSVAFSVSPANSWLSVSATSSTLSSSGSISVNVTANSAAVTSAGTQTGSLTITPAGGSALSIQVTFVPSGSTSTGTGTLTLNGATSNTFTTSFSVVAPNGIPSATCVPIQDTAGVNSYAYVASTLSGGSWLQANFNLGGTEIGNLAPGANACVTISLDPNVTKNLASGTYQGSIAITSASNATATITVNLYVSSGVAPGITVSPSAVYAFPNAAVGSNSIQSVTFNVTAAASYALGTAALTSAANGFSMNSPGQAGNTESFTVTANTTNLAAGIYFTTVTLASSGPSSGTTTITIVQPVGQGGATNPGGGTVTSLIAPLSLTFQQQQGTSFWTGGQEAQAITITGQQGTQFSSSIAYSSASGWLNFDSPTNGSGTFGSGPATLMVDLFNGVSSLSPATYTAQITITTPSGDTTVSVSLLVTPSNTAVLLGKPASATFSSSSGTVPANKTITVVGSDNTGSTSSPLIIAGTPSATWISATTTGNTMTISVSPSGLSTGVYWGTIPVTASNYNNAINYPVVLVVNGGTSSGGPLTLSPSPVSFTNVTGQLSQNLSVTASSATTFTVGTASETSCTGSSWLQVATGTFSASQFAALIAVTVNPFGIANGTTCNGVITLVSGTTTQTVNVSMTVGSSTGSGNVTVSPLSMTFAYTQNQTVPAAQTATIVNAGSGTAGIPFTVTTAETSGTSVTWLSTGGVTQGATPYNNPGLSVSVAPGNLNPGTYQGTVTITPTGGTVQVINVTLTVTGNAVVSATPTTLSLTYQVGGNSPTSTVQVSGGGTAAGFTATATSSAGWLQVTPTSGTTTNSGTVPLTVSAVPSVLNTLTPTPAGQPLTGTITVAGTSPATGTTTINVTLIITAPLPVISGVINAASGGTGAVSPGELISLFAPTTSNNPIGPSNSVQLNSTTCPNPCTQVPTTMGGVQVKFLPGGYLAPLIFVNAGQINAVVPYEVSGLSSTSIEVLYLNQTSNAFPVNVAATVPGIFTVSGGTGQAAAVQYDASGTYQGVNRASNPASKGWYLIIYMTGEGVVNPAAATGSVTKPVSPIPQPYYVPTVLIGGQPATVPAGAYGETSGLVSGVLQVNAIVPAGAGTGPVSLSVSLGTASAQAGVTVYLQ